MEVPLSFREVDDLAFAGKDADLAVRAHSYYPKTLGPLIELFSQQSSGRLPSDLLDTVLAPRTAAPLVRALVGGLPSWLDPVSKRMGFMKMATGSKAEMFTSFLMTAKRSAVEVTKLHRKTAGQLIAALTELENNVKEHSGSAETGMIAFRASKAEFEFSIFDHGKGILASLREDAAQHSLNDHGKALQLALTDGVSRHGPTSGHGHGFRQIFLGLLELHGELRFRTGDHSLHMVGVAPNLKTSRLSQKPTIDGFFVSVSCSTKTTR